MKKHSIKLTALVLALVLTAALALTGCGSKSDDSDGATTIQIAVPNDTTAGSVCCSSSKKQREVIDLPLPLRCFSQTVSERK